MGREEPVWGERTPRGSGESRKCGGWSLAARCRAIAHAVMVAVYGGGPSFLSFSFLFGLPHRQISPYELSRKKLLVVLTTA